MQLMYVVDSFMRILVYAIVYQSNDNIYAVNTFLNYALARRNAAKFFSILRALSEEWK